MKVGGAVEVRLMSKLLDMVMSGSARNRGRTEQLNIASSAGYLAKNRILASR